MENLRALKESHGEQAEEAAAEYANAYKGCRGAMIVDVVASRQRRYLRRVKPMVADWMSANEEHTIEARCRGLARLLGAISGQMGTIGRHAAGTVTPLPIFIKDT